MDANNRRVSPPTTFFSTSSPAPAPAPAAVSAAGRYVSSDHNPTFSHSPPPDSAPKRKRGRPRKYFPAGPNPSSSAAAAASLPPPTAPASPPPPPHPKKPPRAIPGKIVDGVVTDSFKCAAHFDIRVGSSGQSLTPHVLTIPAGEDVTQQILLFVQRQKHAVCILSASGSLSNASLRQPASAGLNMTYEGRFEILSLAGSFLHTEVNGAPSKIGGLSICLSSSDGQMIGGGVGGPLKAEDPVQVIAGTFAYDGTVKLLEETNDGMASMRVERSTPSFGHTNSSHGFQSNHDMFARMPERDKGDHLRAFLSQSQPMHEMTSQLGNWRENQIERGSIGFPGRNDGEHGRTFRFSEDGNDEDLQDQD